MEGYHCSKLLSVAGPHGSNSTLWKICISPDSWRKRNRSSTHTINTIQYPQYEDCNQNYFCNSKLYRLYIIAGRHFILQHATRKSETAVKYVSPCDKSYSVYLLYLLHSMGSSSSQGKLNAAYDGNSDGVTFRQQHGSDRRRNMVSFNYFRATFPIVN